MDNRKLRRVNINENAIGYGDVGDMWFRSAASLQLAFNHVCYFDAVRDNARVIAVDCVNWNDIKHNFGILMAFEI